METLRVIGSGKSQPVLGSYDRCLFVNSAILRVNSNRKVDVIITDGLLATDHELRQAKNASGLNASKSYEMRRAKTDALRRQKIGMLYVISADSELQIRNRLERLGLQFGSLKLVRKSKISRTVVKLCVRSIIPSLPYAKLLLWSVIGSLGVVKIPPRYRPSTGCAAALYASTLIQYSECQIELDGIGGSNKDAFYPDGTCELVHMQFNTVHEKTDQIIFRLLGFGGTACISTRYGEKL